MVTKYPLIIAMLCMFLSYDARADDLYKNRVDVLVKKNISYARALEILNKPEVNTPEELKQAVVHLNRALDQEKEDLNKSVIHVSMAEIYLMGLQDCSLAKQHSSTALSLDPNGLEALGLDVGSDMCIAGTKGEYDAVISRLEEMVRQHTHFRSPYSWMAIAYLRRGDKRKSHDDLVKAKQAFLKAKESNEPILETAPYLFEKFLGKCCDEK